MRLIRDGFGSPPPAPRLWLGSTSPTRGEVGGSWCKSLVREGKRPHLSPRGGGRRGERSEPDGWGGLFLQGVGFGFSLVCKTSPPVPLSVPERGTPPRIVGNEPLSFMSTAPTGARFARIELTERRNSASAEALKVWLMRLSGRQTKRGAGDDERVVGGGVGVAKWPRGDRRHRPGDDEPAGRSVLPPGRNNENQENDEER